MPAIAESTYGGLAEVFRRHRDAVHTCARRVTNDPSAADEVLQEVMLKMWEQPERFDSGRGSLRGFLLTQAHSRAVEAVRSDSARRRRESLLDRSSNGGYDLESEVCGAAIADHIKAAVESLPVGERDAIKLAYFGGYTYREVAEILEEAEGTIKSRIRAGLRRLRRFVEVTGAA